MKNSFNIILAILLFLFCVESIFAQEQKTNSLEIQSVDDKIYSKDEVDTQAIIKKFKIHPKLMKECIDGGSIKLKIVLHKNGQVTDVSVIEENGCGKIQEKFFSSIRKLKFIPAIKNGIPVSQFVIRTLKFNVMGAI